MLHILSGIKNLNNSNNSQQMKALYLNDKTLFEVEMNFYVEIHDQ